VTRDFKELVQKRIARDPAFGDALLREGIDTMLAGDVDTGKAILRDYIKATVGFEKLARRPARARNLFSVIGFPGESQ
jgi:predicted amino acid racemase